MAYALRQFRTDTIRSPVDVETFEPADAAAAMERICEIARHYAAADGRRFAVYGEAEDALLSIAMWLQKTALYGEPVPPPPFSAEMREYLRAAE